MPVGGGRGSLGTIVKIMTNVAKDTDIEEEYRVQIISVIAQIMCAAINNGYKIDEYE